VLTKNVWDLAIRNSILKKPRPVTESKFVIPKFVIRIEIPNLMSHRQAIIGLNHHEKRQVICGHTNHHEKRQVICWHTHGGLANNVGQVRRSPDTGRLLGGHTDFELDIMGTTTVTKIQLLS
jgi:hypothetical protein